jgi:hypothetical protein
LVIDVSRTTFALLGRCDLAAGLRRCLAVEVYHAPHLIDAEVGNVPPSSRNAVGKTSAIDSWADPQLPNQI